jgi:hypothetical protein
MNFQDISQSADAHFWQEALTTMGVRIVDFSLKRAIETYRIGVTKVRTCKKNTYWVSKQIQIYFSLNSIREIDCLPKSKDRRIFSFIDHCLKIMYLPM